MKNTTEKSQLKAGILLNYVNIGLGNLIPIFYTPIMLAILGQHEYGLYKLSSSVTSYLSLVSLGIGSAVTRYLIKAKTEEGTEAEEKILGLFMLIFQIIAVIAFGIGLILVSLLPHIYGNSLSSYEINRMRILVFLMVCNTALTFSVSPYVSVVSAHEKFLFMQSMNILTTCVAPIANLVALFLGYASIGMATSSLIICLIVQMGYLFYVRSSLHIKAIYKNLPVNLLKEILTFSFWVFVANVVSQLYNSTDTVMIGMIPKLATTGVAVYNIGAVFNNIVFNLATGMSSLLTPKANRMVFEKASNEELTDLTIRVGRIQCYLIMLIITGFIAFGQPFISFYAGEGYEQAYWVAIFMMIPNMIPLVQSVCLSIIVAENKHRFRSIVYLFIAVANVIGTWFLMHTPLGIVGAALMTGLALIVGQGFVMNWYYWKKTGLNMPRFWKNLGPIYIIPIIMCIITVGISKFIDFYRIPVLIAGIMIYTVVFCFLNYCLIMNTYEKDLIIGFLKKLHR